MWLLGSRARARIMGYLCTREWRVVNTTHMRHVCELSSGTQYLRVFRDLERFGMLSRSDTHQWVVESSDSWRRVRELTT